MRNPTEYLHLIQTAISKVATYTQKGRQAFDAEEDIRLSIIYYLQTLSEAARALPQEFQRRYSLVPWKHFAEYQSYITYYYREIDRDALWNIAYHDLPMLKISIDFVAAKAAEEAAARNIRSPQGKSKTSSALEKLLQDNREEILSIAQRYGVSNVRVFGSVVRGEADRKSDIDLLVDVVPGHTLFDLGEFLADLQNLLGYEVDVVTEKSLNNRIREHVMKEAIPL